MADFGNAIRQVEQIATDLQDGTATTADAVLRLTGALATALQQVENLNKLVQAIDKGR